MSRSDLIRRIRQRPFTPFRMIVSEGATYDIRHPDQLMVTRDSAVVGLPGAPEQEFYETSVLVDLLHIVRLEPVAVQASTGNGEGSA